MPQKSSLTFLHPSCSSFYRMVHRFRGLSIGTSVRPSETPHIHRFSLVDYPPKFADCPLYHSSTAQTYKIRRRCIWTPKIMKQVLLCSLKYSLSSKHKFGTKKCILMFTKVMHFYNYKVQNLFSRSPKIMKLVLLASFKHVLSRIHICVHHVITYVHMTWPLCLTHLNQPLNKWRRVCHPSILSVSLFTETEELETTILS